MLLIVGMCHRNDQIGLFLKYTKFGCKIVSPSSSQELFNMHN